MTGKTRRVAGVDVARALAIVTMVQAHAYDGWVAERHRATLAYRITRSLATLPLPSFLLLAGTALALPVLSAARAGAPASPLRRRLVRRGLEVVAIAYAVNLAYGLLDGAGELDTFLRVDVLHAIGASIAIVAFFGVRSAGDGDAVAPRRLLGAAVAVGLVTTLPSFALQALGASASGPLRYVAALFVDVPGVTRMPVFPLAGWLCLGVCIAFPLDRSRREAGGAFAEIAGASPRLLGALFAGSLVVATTAAWATEYVAGRSATPLTRAHPAILLNVVDLGARGVLLLAASAALSVALPTRLRAFATIVGQGSLFVYVVHIPFCYGRPGAALARKLGMAEATGALLLLYALSIGSLFARERVRGLRRAMSSVPPPESALAVAEAADGRTETPRARSRS